MEASTLDLVTDRLHDLLEQRERFEARFDHEVAGYLDPLPGLFRLFHWLTFDLEVSPEQRRKAASIAVYIAEGHDFCGESSRGVEGLIDDLWLAYTGLNQLAKSIPLDRLQPHWRSKIPIFRALELSRDLRCLERHIPSRVLDRLHAFIA